MANKLLGEVAVRTPGGDTYTLAFGIECLIEIEDRFGFDPDELGQVLGDGLKGKVLKGLFHAAMRDKHPDVDEATSGRVLSEVGVLPATAALVRAFMGAFAVDPETGKAAVPQQAPAPADAGTGASS